MCLDKGTASRTLVGDPAAAIDMKRTTNQNWPICWWEVCESGGVLPFFSEKKKKKRETSAASYCLGVSSALLMLVSPTGGEARTGVSPAAAPMQQGGAELPPSVSIHSCQKLGAQSTRPGGKSFCFCT